MLTSTVELAAYFESAAVSYPQNPKGIANWVMTEILRQLKTLDSPIEKALPATRLAALVRLVDNGEISSSAAKEVFAAIWNRDEEPRDAMQRLRLVQIRDAQEIGIWVGEVLAENPKPVAQFLEGKTKALEFLVGQVMKRSAGRADPQQAQDLLRQSLDRLQGEAQIHA